MIAKTGLHAIRAMALLAGLPEGQCSGAAAIAKEIEAPPNYLGKLLRTMVRVGLVDSRKGPGGGFRLAREPGSIRLLDIVEPIEPVHRWNVCLLGRPECSDDASCAVHSRWQQIRDGYVEMLADTTLADLIEPQSGKAASTEGNS
ncbi:MAG: RrF2 family transcriptional regulator [Planctomycetota bacterium]